MRNVYRRYTAWTKGGERALVHRARGKKGNHAYSEELKTRTRAIVKNELKGYAPVRATEVPQEAHGIAIHSGAPRRWTRGDAMATRQYRTRAHRAKRPRRLCAGERVRGDGSFHRWLGADRSLP